MSGRSLGASSNVRLLKGLGSRSSGRYNGTGRDWETPPEVGIGLGLGTLVSAKSPGGLLDRGSTP